MKLIRIELNNFRQFYGRQVLEFSIDNEKRVTLIHAENGVGKTAFLNAILWCFFETTTDNFSEPSKIINKVAKSEGKTTYGVTIDFEHNGDHYSVQRNQINGDKKFKVYFRTKTGINEEKSDPWAFINTVIPKAMAPYFFFQGEGVGSFASGRHGIVREAIERILGFTVAQKAIEDLKKIKSEKRRRFDSLDTHDALAQIQNELADVEDELEKREKEQFRLSDEVDKLTEKIDLIDKKFRESNSEAIKEKEKRRKSLENQLVSLEQNINVAQSKRVALITEYATSVFSKKLVDEGVPYLDDKEIEGTIPAPFNERVVKEILDNHECICGNHIEHGTDAHHKIMLLLKQAADPQLTKRIQKTRAMLTKLENDQRRSHRQFTETFDEIGRFEGYRDKMSIELRDISVELEGIDLDGISDLERQRRELSKQKSQTDQRLGSINSIIDQLKKRIKDLETKVDHLEASSPEAQSVKDELKVCEILAEHIEKILEDTRNISLRRVREKVNNFIERFVRQDYKAWISDDYQLDLLDRNNDIVPKSDGQSLLLSLTFISALISLARERANADGVILEPGALAPFVVDAPFGVLDNEYKANIAREIPNSVDQVVFLLSSSHWEGAVENELRESIGKEYVFRLHDIGGVKNDIEQSIIINGKTYLNVIYDADRDMTEIVEVKA